MDRRETEQLLEAIHQTRAAGRPAAMATIVRVMGSAYRREGTRMFVRQDGTYECALSGGCLEPAVAEAAKQVIETGQPALVSYDLADDSLWGLGIGCMGAVEIRIERLEDEAITNTWLKILEHEEAAVLITPLSGTSGRMIVRDSGATVGALSDPTIEQKAAAGAVLRLRHPSPESGVERIGAAELFFEVAAPPPRLVIFGAGPDAVPLVQLAYELGFAVTIVDPRETFLAPDRFPDATRVCAQPSEFADRVRVGASDFVLVMNHHVERDQESFRVSLESDAAYIGVLGPRARYEKVLARLAAQGCVPDPGTLARVHSPVGLSVGAETPQEVAVSILGEILAIRRRFEGGFLTGSMRSLHRPDDTR